MPNPEKLPPAAQQFVDDVLAQIASGELVAGDILLPTGPNMAPRYGCSYSTIRKGFRYLVREGVITTGNGTPTRIAAVPGRATDTTPMMLIARLGEIAIDLAGIASKLDEIAVQLKKAPIATRRSPGPRGSAPAS